MASCVPLQEQSCRVLRFLEPKSGLASPDEALQVDDGSLAHFEYVGELAACAETSICRGD